MIVSSETTTFEKLYYCLIRKVLETLLITITHIILQTLKTIRDNKKLTTIVYEPIVQPQRIIINYLLNRDYVEATNYVKKYDLVAD